ncbi:MAG: hypothetical protein ACOCWJ_02715 [Verrucomicrobiota bacterium]
MQTSQTKTIALDIDDMLTSMDIPMPKGQEELDPVHHRPEAFLTVKFVHGDREYEVDNVLVPGCLEFFCFLFGQETVRPAFFSAGIRQRNLALGRMIVESAIEFGQGDPSWRERYEVYSREDCFDTERLGRLFDDEIARKFQPPGYFGNYKKDLRVIHYGRERYRQLFWDTLEDPEVLMPDPDKDAPMLETVLMVEEDPSYLFPGQEKNFLLCPMYRHPEGGLKNYDRMDMPPIDPDDWRCDFKNTNTLFYAAGVLHHALDRHRREGIPLPEAVWQAQGKLWIDRECRDERFPLHFFEEGRTVLRRYNPNLNFAVSAANPQKK